jgi:hypothetical protein
MFTRSLIFLPVLLAGAFGQQIPGGPMVTVFRGFMFPPVGLAASETAQLNIVNMAPASSVASASAPSCSGTITFTNASGATIGSAINFTTTGSQIFSTELSFAKLAATGTRAEFVAAVQLSAQTQPITPCSPAFSLETFDSTSGVTHVFLGNSSSVLHPSVTAVEPVAGH